MFRGMSCKKHDLGGWFLLTNFDSVLFKTLYLALNKFNYYSEI